MTPTAVPDRLLRVETDLVRANTAQEWFEREVREAVRRIETSIQEGNERLGGNIRDLQAELRGVSERIQAVHTKDIEAIDDRLGKVERTQAKQHGIGLALAAVAGFFGGSATTLKDLFHG